MRASVANRSAELKTPQRPSTLCRAQVLIAGGGAAEHLAKQTRRLGEAWPRRCRRRGRDRGKEMQQQAGTGLAVRGRRFRGGLRPRSHRTTRRGAWGSSPLRWRAGCSFRAPASIRQQCRPSCQPLHLPPGQATPRRTWPLPKRSTSHLPGCAPGLRRLLWQHCRAGSTLGCARAA